MKQVYAIGTLSSGNSTVKATSAGTNADSVQNILPLSNYSLNTPETDKPVRLSLLTTTSGRVLTHVAPVGEQFFSHQLLDVPTSTDAHTAIQTWGSPQWQRKEVDTKSDLPDLPFLPVADVLDDNALKTWLTDHKNRDMLEFTFSAMITTTPSSRIVLHAKAEDVAMIVYAVTRAFPTNLADNLTFSTFETDAHNCNARIVGTFGYELSDYYFENGNVTYSKSGERKSKLSKEVGFAAFASKALASGNVGELDDFRGIWQRLGLSDPAQLDLIDRLFRGSGEVSKEEMTAALQSPAISQWVSVRNDAVRQLTDWAIEDRDFATGSFARVVQAMRQKADHINKLAENVKQAGFAAIQAGDVGRVGTTFDVILPMIAPSKANSVWADIIAKFNQPAQLPDAMRWHLLTRIVRFKQQQNENAKPAELADWLNTPAEKLQDILKLDLPKAYLVHATKLTRQPDDLPTVVKAIGSQPAIALATIKPASDEEYCAAVFEKLVENEPNHPWFEDVVRNASDYPPVLLNKFLEAELAKGKTDVDRLICTQGNTLFSLFAGRSGLEALTNRFLQTPPSDLLTEPNILEFLEKSKTHDGTSDILKQKIAAVLTVRDYLKESTFDQESLEKLAKAFEYTPTPLPSTAKPALFQKLAGSLSKEFNSLDFQTHYESVIKILGNTLAKGPSDLFQDLLRELRKQLNFAVNTNVVASTLGIALGANKAESLNGQLDGLEPDAFAIAADASKAGKMPLLEEIDRRSKDWPKEAKAKWGFLREAVKPQSSRAGRDIACFVLGVAVAAAAVIVMKMLKL